jgi:hypothetical protein
MENKMIVAIALVLLSFGSLSAFAAGGTNRCVDQQAMLQFTNETAALNGALKAKEVEIAEQKSSYWGIERSGYDGPDFSTIDKLDTERKEIKAQIATVAKKYGIMTCCAG